MAIVILFVCFISIFLSLGILLGGAVSKKQVLLSAMLVFSASVVFITEGLSLFKQLNYWAVLLSWLVVAALTITYIYLNRYKANTFYTSIKNPVKQLCKQLNRYEVCLLLFVLIILLLVFIQGIIYPPNNWDSMTYHMARIPSWVSHRSVAHYPTTIIRQLYQPPFAEFVITQFNILNTADYFSATVQFAFLLFAIIALVYIVSNIGLKREYQVIAIVLTATIPEVILQASSTQNDIVVSFFVIAASVFAVLAIKQNRFSNYLFFALAVGLGFLTKGTAYLYFTPIILIFVIAILVRLFKTRHISFLKNAIATVFIIVAVNAGHYSRNYALYHNILGVDKTESKSYSNQKMSPLLLASSIVKNAGLHFNLLFDNHINKAANKAIYKLHQLAGININDPATNYFGAKYNTLSDVTHEDSAPNLIHFLMIITASLILIAYNIKNKASFMAKLLFITVALQIIVFCYYLKWQPWNTRLHIPFFLLSVPLIVYAASVNKVYKRAVYYLIIPLLIATAVITVLHNNSRSYSKAMFNSRYQNYFTNQPKIYPEYNAVVNNINIFRCKNVGLIVRADDYVYPLFTQCYSEPLNPVYLNVNNITGTIKAGTIIDCIVSTSINKPSISFGSKVFYNQNSSNKTIFFYK